MESITIPTVLLKPNRERSLLRKHPWVFSGAIDRIDGQPGAGETIRVCDSRGNTLGFGAYSPISQIRIRMWSFETICPDIEGLIRLRVKQAASMRQSLTGLTSSNASRLIHAESDLLPGVIADMYGDVVVVQLSTAGAYYWRDIILDSIQQETQCACLLEKSDTDVLTLEGLEPVIHIVKGLLENDFWICEHGLDYFVKPLDGQKTGFYMDQRDNHLLIRSFSKGKRVLDCFSYSGAFALNAISGGAESVELIDSSESALELAKSNFDKNKLLSNAINFTCANVFDRLRKLRDRAAYFDLIVLDPPKLAPTHAQVERAARAYKDLNLLAFKLLNPNSILFTFSCSGGLSMDLFKKIVADAAYDAGKEVQFIHQMHQAADHPILTTFPEGEYLKGLVCTVK